MSRSMIEDSAAGRFGFNAMLFVEGALPAGFIQNQGQGNFNTLLKEWGILWKAYLQAF